MFALSQTHRQTDRQTRSTQYSAALAGTESISYEVTLQGTQTSAPKYIPAASSEHTRHTDLGLTGTATSNSPPADPLTSRITSSPTSLLGVSIMSRDDVTADDVSSSIMSRHFTAHIIMYHVSCTNIVVYYSVAGLGWLGLRTEGHQQCHHSTRR